MTEPTTLLTSAPPAPLRFAAVDAMRGVGAVAIAAYHIHRYGPLPQAADEILPAVITELVSHGWMAVPMFLVVAGFVTAYALRHERLNLAALILFAVRRGLRLGSPYWAVLLLVLAMSYPAIAWLHDTSLTEPISWQQLLTSVFFLQDILGYGNISRGMWFVCIDMQFGLLVVGLLWVAQSLPFCGPKGSRADALVLSAIFLPLAWLSLFVFGVNEANDMGIHYFFFMPCFGMWAWWTLEGRLPQWQFWVYLAVLLAAVAQRWHAATLAGLDSSAAWDELVGFDVPYDVEKLFMTIVTGVAILGLGRAGHLGDWFRARWLQYLGKISYSLFLIHYPVSWVVITIGYRLTGDRRVAASLWLVLAFVCSVGAAHLLQRFVEGPSLRLVQRLKLRATRPRLPAEPGLRT